MKTLNVSVCCYHRNDEDPNAEKQGILLRNGEDSEILLDVTSLEKVDIDECVIREMPGQGCFALPHSFSPELRQAVKDSRRIARVS